jgi:hypothetical protein
MRFGFILAEIKVAESILKKMLTGSLLTACLARAITPGSLVLLQ